MSDKKNKNLPSSEDEKKAESFFRSKLKKNYHETIDNKDNKFRDLDEESVKLSKLKARINFLKNNKTSEAKLVATDKDILSPNEKLDINLKLKKSDKSNTKSKKNSKVRDLGLDDTIKILNDKIDEFGNVVKCFSIKKVSGEESKYIVLKSFEINSKLYKFGKAINISESMLSFLMEGNFIRKLNKYEISKESKKPFHVKKTFGLSEFKKSSLINKKKLND